MSETTSHSGDLSKIAGRLSADDVNAGDLAYLDGLIADLLRDDPSSELAVFLETTAEHLRAHRDLTWVAVYSAANLPEDHPAYAAVQRVRESSRPAHQ